MSQAMIEYTARRTDDELRSELEALARPEAGLSTAARQLILEAAYRLGVAERLKALR